MTILTRFLTGTVAALALAAPAVATEYRIAVGDGAGGPRNIWARPSSPRSRKNPAAR